MEEASQEVHSGNLLGLVAEKFKASASEANLPAFDAESLLERLMGDRALAAIILAAFLEDCPKQMRILRDCIDEANSPGLKLQAHSLKGAAATISALRLSKDAFALEEAAENLDAEQWNSLLWRIEFTFADFENTLAHTGWQNSSN